MHFYELYLVSGHPLAFLDAMTAWGGIQASVYLICSRTCKVLRWMSSRSIWS